MNLRVGYAGARWSASLFARNLFDESYAMRGFFFENEPPDFPTKRYVQPADGRLVGATLAYVFQ